MKSFSIKEALRFAWTTFKRDPWVYVGATAIIMVVSAIMNSFTDNNDAGLVEVVIGVAGTLLLWWLYLGLARMGLTAHSGASPKLDMLFKESWDVLWRYTLAMILTGIIVLIGIILLIVPGIIAQVALSLVMFLVLEKGMRPIQALKESRRMTKGRRWDIFWFLLVLVALNIVGMIVFMVGLLVTIPLSVLAFVYVYRSIDKGDDMEPVAPTQMPPASNPVPPAAPAATV